jgi:hypothetical protein
MDLESNNVWINWINDILTKSNQNKEPYENVENVMGESKLP